MHLKIIFFALAKMEMDAVEVTCNPGAKFFLETGKNSDSDMHTLDCEIQNVNSNLLVNNRRLEKVSLTTPKNGSDGMWYRGKIHENNGLIKATISVSRDLKSFKIKRRLNPNQRGSRLLTFEGEVTSQKQYPSFVAQSGRRNLKQFFKQVNTELIGSRSDCDSEACPERIETCAEIVEGKAQLMNLDILIFLDKVLCDDDFGGKDDMCIYYILGQIQDLNLVTESQLGLHINPKYIMTPEQTREYLVLEKAQFDTVVDSIRKASGCVHDPSNLATGGKAEFDKFKLDTGYEPKDFAFFLYVFGRNVQANVGNQESSKTFTGDASGWVSKSENPADGPMCKCNIIFLRPGSDADAGTKTWLLMAHQIGHLVGATHVDENDDRSIMSTADDTKKDDLKYEFDATNGKLMCDNFNIWRTGVSRIPGTSPKRCITPYFEGQVVDERWGPRLLWWILPCAAISLILLLLLIIPCIYVCRKKKEIDAQKKEMEPLIEENKKLEVHIEELEKKNAAQQEKYERLQKIAAHEEEEHLRKTEELQEKGKMPVTDPTTIPESSVGDGVA